MRTRGAARFARREPIQRDSWSRTGGCRGGINAKERMMAQLREDPWCYGSPTRRGCQPFLAAQILDSPAPGTADAASPGRQAPHHHHTSRCRALTVKCSGLALAQVHRALHISNARPSKSRSLAGGGGAGSRSGAVRLFSLNLIIDIRGTPCQPLAGRRRELRNRGRAQHASHRLGASKAAKPRRL